jgi:phytoene dehydrogenase-like protein
MKRYDLVIIGGGHNGLVTAAYVARAGWSVLVLERRDVLGGACVTEELWPGFRVSTAAYVNSLFRPTIIRDLELKKHGFRMLARNPSSFTPFPDGRYLLMGPDEQLNRHEISKFSPRDAETFPRYEQMLRRVAEIIEPTLDEAPPNPWGGWRDWIRLGKLAWRIRRLGREAATAIEILTGAARPILDRWFESEELKVTLATDAIIGAFASPSTPGTAYVLFHHVMGECDGARGVWGYVEGGMGALSQAIASAAQSFGAEIRTEAPVRRIITRRGEATGVVLDDGTEIGARRVASSVDCHVTFFKLLDPRELPDDYVRELRRIDYSSASLKINCAISELPDFRCLPGKTVGPQHRGTIHICPSFDTMERAFLDAQQGCPSAQPILEVTIPTSVDPTLAPPGHHLLSMFVQYAPYHLRGTTWDEQREAFADRCCDLLNEYAPNFKRSILHRQVLAPPDIERIFGLTGGNIFQGAMPLSNLFFMRPVAGWAQYRTPIKGLYLCGSASHPGGGVMGACGRNAARVILRDG